MQDEQKDYPYTEYKVGDHVPASGVYKCGVSGEEMTLEAGDDFPECEPATDENATWVLVEKF